MEQSNEQLEMDFFFWIGDPATQGALSVSEEEFNELYEAKRKLQDDFLNVRIDIV